MLLAPLEAVLTAIMDDNAILKLPTQVEEVAWPLDASENQITVGIHLRSLSSPLRRKNKKTLSRPQRQKLATSGTGPKKPAKAQKPPKNAGSVVN